MRVLVSLCVVLILNLASVTFAQDGSSEAIPIADDAREAFRRGEAAYSAGNHNLAIREWTSAYATDPRPRIQFNLSQAYERLGDLENAMAALRIFLDSGDPDDPMYSDATSRLSALEQRMAMTGVIVKGGDDGGTILVDDKDWGRTPRPDRIPLTPGSHVLVVRWPGRPDFRANVIVPAGQVIDVDVPVAGDSSTRGAAATSKPKGKDTPANAAADSRTSKKRMLFYGIGGGTAALGVAALVYGIVRGGDVVDCNKEYCPDPSQSDTAQWQSITGYVAGGLLLAGGGTLIVLGALSKDDRQRASTTCGVGLASASCRVRF